MVPEKLDAVYEHYLREYAASEACRYFIESLRKAGLFLEANHLNNWQKRRRDSDQDHVGPLPPAVPKVGDCWFDTVAMCKTVFLTVKKTGEKAWLSLSPVKTWQYSAFLRIARWRIINDPFLTVDDAMTSSRLDHLQETDAVTNIYHEEALAYAMWFHKSLCTEYELSQAFDSISHDLLDDLRLNLHQKKLRIWDVMRTGDDDENTRDTICIADEALSLRSDVVAEWETHQDIGFVTAADGDASMTAEVYGDHTEFVVFENSLCRSEFVKT